MRATARPAAKLSAPAVVLVIPRTRRIAKPHEDQVQRQSPGVIGAVEEGMHLLKGVVQPGERLGERLARPERRRWLPASFTWSVQVAVLTFTKVHDGGRMPAGKGRMSCRRIRWACTRQHRPVSATITELPDQVR